MYLTKNTPKNDRIWSNSTDFEFKFNHIWSKMSNDVRIWDSKRQNSDEFKHIGPSF